MLFLIGVLVSLFLKGCGWVGFKKGWNRFFVIDFRLKVISIEVIVLKKNELEEEFFPGSECHRGSEDFLDLASYCTQVFALGGALFLGRTPARDENF